MRSNERDNFRGKGQVRRSYRGKYKDNGRKRDGRQMNPIDTNTGEIFRCNICKNIFHFCPDLESGFPKKKNEIKLQYYKEEIFHTFKDETATMAVLDSGFTKTACGENWLTQYLELFPEDGKKQVTKRKSDEPCRFGNSEEIKAIKRMEIPARIVGIVRVLRPR